MKRLSFIIFSVILSCSLTVSAQKKAAINFKFKEFDFGKIREADGAKSVKFEFTNTGNDTLRLLNADAGYSIVSLSWTKTPVPPNGSGIITVSVNPKNQKGAFSKNITVTSNDPDLLKVTLNIKGEVQPMVKSEADNYPNKIGNLGFNTSLIALNNINNTDSRTDTVKFFNEWVKPIIFTFTSLPEYITCKAFPASVMPGKKGYILVTFDASKSKEFGSINDRFAITTTDSLQPVKFIYISGNIIEDFSKWTPEQLKNAPKIRFEKQVYDFGTIKSGDKIEYDFKFTNIGKSELVIRNTKGSCGCTVATVEKLKIQPGDSSVVKVVFNSAGKSGEQHKTVTITCNDPSNASTVLNIQGKVEKTVTPVVQQKPIKE